MNEVSNAGDYRTLKADVKAVFTQSSFRQLPSPRFRQPEARDESDRVDRGADESAGMGEPGWRRGAWHERNELRGDERRGRADHPATHVRGKALPRAPQVRRIHARQVVAPETELRNRQETDSEDAPAEQREAAGRREQEHQREQDEPRNLKYA